MARAFQDVKRLAEAVSVLISADLADYSADERAYDRLAEDVISGFRRGSGSQEREHRRTTRPADMERYGVVIAARPR